MVSQLDFSDPSAVDQINAWCNQTTEGLIPSILEEVNPTATVYLLNSLYFKARWESEFAPEKTQEGDFNTSSGKVVKADFMQTQRMAAYVENEWFTSTSLSYQNDSYVMRLILPQPEISIDQVLQALSESDGNLWKNVVLADINLKMPRFTLENKMNLIPALQALGMKKAFTNEADFSSMSDIATYISLVQQATRLKVNRDRRRFNESLTRRKGGFLLRSSVLVPNPRTSYRDCPVHGASRFTDIVNLINEL